MASCPTCNTVLDDNHPAFKLQYLLEWIEKSGGWAIFENVKYVVGTPITAVPGVTIAAIKSTYETGDVDVEGYYGESSLPQGSEFETYIVFQIGDLYYKKTGTGDSYGDVDWNGDIKQVQATTKTVLEFK